MCTCAQYVCTRLAPIINQKERIHVDHVHLPEQLSLGHSRRDLLKAVKLLHSRLYSVRTHQVVESLVLLNVYFVRTNNEGDHVWLSIMSEWIAIAYEWVLLNDWLSARILINKVLAFIMPRYWFKSIILWAWLASRAAFFIWINDWTSKSDLHTHTHSHSWPVAKLLTKAAYLTC